MKYQTRELKFVQTNDFISILLDIGEIVVNKFLALWSLYSVVGNKPVVC